MTDFLRSLFNLEGREVVVTGAAGYFGGYVAETFLEAGARVILLSRSARLLEQCEAYRARFGADRVSGYAIDFYQQEALNAVLREIARDHAPAVLVNNAFDFSVRTGFNTPEGRLEASTFEQWENAFQSGIYWAVRATQVLGEGMRERRQGSIINIASMYAVVTPAPDLYEGTTYFNPPAYSVAKAGLLAFTRYVAAFWGLYGVRCNALLPGPFPNTEESSYNAVGKGDDFLDRLAARTLLKRVGHPRDLRGALVLLASDAGSYITGQGIIVDGGWVAK